METLVAALALWILISGLDDLFVDAAWLVTRRAPDVPPPGGGAPRRIAIFVPLWHESAVVRRMIEHNTAAIRYSDYRFYLGVYPNDAATRSEVEALSSIYPNVSVVTCPHDGPTSKADCLNWIYRRASIDGFDVAVTHDAEDVIHPDSLELIDRATRVHAMVQVPVLPLPTPAADLVHGVYCDEFAESQLKELPARVRLGGFLPSCGVGTAFTRELLDQLSAAHGDCIFEPGCLTEDYENGFRVWRLGGRQWFAPAGLGTMTREYFPRSFRAAVRQRARWLMGIALQSWELHGWRDLAPQAYWFWRDRKGLIGNLVSPVANLVLAEALISRAAGTASWFAAACNGYSWLAPVAIATLLLQSIRQAVRTRCTAEIYGWWFAALVPIRAPLSNAINAAATVLAMSQYFARRLRGRPLVWFKTEHAYPAADAETALDPLPGRFDAAAARVLPASVTHGWRMLPVKIEAGRIHLAAMTPPTGDALRAVARHCPLRIRFHLVNAAEFARMEGDYASVGSVACFVNASSFNSTV